MDAKLVSARANLERILHGLSEVRLVDVGQERGSKSPFFRVHLAPGTDLDRLGIPTQVDGIPVRVLIADYRLD